MLPRCVLVLVAAQAYVDRFFPLLPELELLLDRIAELDGRIMAVRQAHEEWLGCRSGQN